MVIQNSQPLVSVIVPIFNGARYIVECLNSVVTQSYTNLEILVIDDGSLDNSVEVVNSFISKHPKTAIRLYCQSNGGSSAARNTGLINAKGEYVAFLDADDFWFPNKVEKHISEMIRTKSKVVGSLMRYANSNSRMFGICGEESSNRQADIKLGRLMPVVLSSIIFESQLIATVSGFDEQLRFSQDLDLLARCAQLTEIRVLPLPLGVYRLHGSSISTVNGFEQEKSFEYIKFKYADYPNNPKDSSYLEFCQSNLLEIGRERKAGLHFRNFGVETMNGRVFSGADQLLRALSASPLYVFRRLALRVGNWITWKIQRNGNS
jgi:glycosyltransferase involved in cell wall biosynthesis